MLKKELIRLKINIIVIKFRIKQALIVSDEDSVINLRNELATLREKLNELNHLTTSTILAWDKAKKTREYFGLQKSR